MFNSILFLKLGAKQWQKISENRIQYFGNENFVNILTSLKVRPEALEKGESSTKLMSFITNLFTVCYMLFYSNFYCIED